MAWLQAHPRPGIYLRQVDMPGIHSKFIEAQRGVLAELLDLALPAAAIDTAASGATQFARRYGFRDKPLRVRFRLLDPAHCAWVASGTDAGLSPLTQRCLRPARRRRCIARLHHRERDQLPGLPAVPDSLVVFGAGYGFDVLAAGRLAAATRHLHYWGDIDTHGFAILDQLRAPSRMRGPS